jgi:hypothetical protein
MCIGGRREVVFSDAHKGSCHDVASVSRYVCSRTGITRAPGPGCECQSPLLGVGALHAAYDRVRLQHTADTLGCAVTGISSAAPLLTESGPPVGRVVALTPADVRAGFAMRLWGQARS